MEVQTLQIVLLFQGVVALMSCEVVFGAEVVITLLAVCTIRVSDMFQVLLGIQVERQLLVTVEETIAGLTMLHGLFDPGLHFGNRHLYR